MVASADPTASIAPVTEHAQPVPVVQEVEPQPKPVVTASLGDPSEVLTPAATPEQGAEASTGDAANTAKQIVGTAEILDECYVIDACADRYLWALYQRTRKEDTVKEKTQREVTVKRKGKMVTVTRTLTQVVDEDFGWKDPKAADHAGMAMTDYVIGGMDREFKLRLFRLLLAAEQAGLSPGITSAFRDNYRQSIASGLKAADDRSFHGGSLRGGYGHGLAADIVSVNGATRALRQEFEREAVELGRQVRQGVRDRAALSRQGSAACGSHRRLRICQPSRGRTQPARGRREAATRGRGTRRTERGATRQNRERGGALRRRASRTSFAEPLCVTFSA